MRTAGSLRIFEALLFACALQITACHRRPADPSARVARRGDHLIVQISDLTPGETNRIPVRLSDKGEIRLPLVGDVKVEGLDAAGVARAVKKAYADPGILHDCRPSVTFDD